MSSSREALVKTPENDKTIIGKILGDTLIGSCWRAVQSAREPDVEVRVYVRSFAEAQVALELIMGMTDKLGLMKQDVTKDEAEREARALDAFVAISLTNGSVIVLKPESRGSLTPP